MNLIGDSVEILKNRAIRKKKITNLRQKKKIVGFKNKKIIISKVIFFYFYSIKIIRDLWISDGINKTSKRA